MSSLSTKPILILHVSLDWTLIIIEHICELILVWDRPDPEAVARVKEQSQGTRFPVRLDIVEGRDATLSNRYKPYDELKTETILQIDDDILARPQGILAGLRYSQENPNQLVSWASCVKVGLNYR